MLLLLYRIAYFYQVSSRQSTHYRLFLIPVGLFGLSGLLYAALGNPINPAENVWADAAQIVGGAVLVMLGMFLLRKMTGGRR